MNTTRMIHTSEIWVHTPDQARSNLSPQAQVLFCPKCESFESFINRGQDNFILKGLECKKELEAKLVYVA